jgi:hypothetical protein
VTSHELGILAGASVRGLLLASDSDRGIPFVARDEIFAVAIFELGDLSSPVLALTPNEPALAPCWSTSRKGVRMTADPLLTFDGMNRFVFFEPVSIKSGRAEIAVVRQGASG